MANFTLQQLKYLCASIDHQSLARAAETLNVSQPTISMAIAKLEDRMGIQLLVRHHSQGVSLAPNSEEFLQGARRLIAQAEDLQQIAISSSTDLSGTLRIGSFSALAPMILPGLISSLSDQFPKIDVNLAEGTQNQIIDELQQGKIEMAVLYDIGLPDDLRRVSLASRQPYVALPEGHPLAGQQDVALGQLTNEPLILLDVVPSRSYFLGLFDEVGEVPTIAYSSPSIELVRGLVGRGLGYSILVTRPFGDMTSDGHQIAVRPLRDQVTQSRIVLASHKNLRPSRLMQCLEDVALNLFSAAD